MPRQTFRLFCSAIWCSTSRLGHTSTNVLSCHLLAADIFKRAPEVMYRALMIHNGVIRAAKFSNCGFVLEQEGDSYTLAFYDAVDAVAFCLQVRTLGNSSVTVLAKISMHTCLLSWTSSLTSCSRLVNCLAIASAEQWFVFCMCRPNKHCWLSSGQKALIWKDKARVLVLCRSGSPAVSSVLY